MMKRQIAAACALAAVLSQSAWAADYTFSGPEQGLFARPTSDDTIYVDKPEVNVDRSKNTALIPPAFGSATSYLTGSGTTMTPYLDSGGQRQRIRHSDTAYHIGQHQYRQHRYREL